MPDVPEASTFADYQKAAVKTAIFLPALGALYPALGLCGEAGEVAELIKKAYRDDGGEFDAARLEALHKELGDCLWYIATLADLAGLSLADIAQSNLRKLADRQARGVLGGSGNAR
jgi:NTP pyrophosphatase (non-canonical NTP hydrolase)